MTDFEKWFYTEDAEKFGLYPDMHSARAAWNYQETKLKEMDEVIKMQDADLRKYEKQIESLREQLNNMETCYIEKKKECEDQQKRIDGALTWLTRTDIRPINCAREILRGGS
ncbi:hypothetical protein ABEF79_08695 [Acinetobacter sp. ANC 7454]|uniref:hypothetical protein n=1 Tax=Acinetobacter thermotolerans TaxID=3151487 RepID=UPI00325B7BF8